MRKDLDAQNDSKCLYFGFYKYLSIGLLSRNVVQNTRLFTLVFIYTCIGLSRNVVQKIVYLDLIVYSSLGLFAKCRLEYKIVYFGCFIYICQQVFSWSLYKITRIQNTRLFTLILLYLSIGLSDNEICSFRSEFEKQNDLIIYMKFL